MNKVYQIIKQLQSVSKTNDKLAILNQNKDNEDLKKYFFLVYSETTHQFYQTKIKKDRQQKSDVEISISDLECIKENLSTRKVSGNAAIEYLTDIYSSVSSESKQLLEWMIKRDIQAKVNIGLINKVWKNLICEQGYQRCSLSSDVDLSKWDWNSGIICQVKEDGMFFNFNIFENSFEVKSRNGSSFPKEYFIDIFNELKFNNVNYQFHGEGLVYEDGKMLPRKIGNGILTSILKGGELPKNCEIKYVVWDIISYENSIRGIENIPYEDRFKLLKTLFQKQNMFKVCLIETKICYSYSEALQFYKTVIKNGGEGIILKKPNGIWKDYTSKEQVKLKIDFDCELKIVGFNEGNNKYAGMLGSFICESEDGKLKVNVSGFSDSQRESFWEDKSELLNKIVTVRSNSIIESENSGISLFLPRFVEIRFDKKTSDNIEQIQKIFNSILFND